MRCPKCGKKIEENTAACPVCGTKLTAELRSAAKVEAPKTKGTVPVIAKMPVQEPKNKRCCKCGKKLENGVCPNCGGNAKTTVTPAPLPKQTHIPSSRSDPKPARQETNKNASAQPMPIAPSPVKPKQTKPQPTFAQRQSAHFTGKAASSAAAVKKTATGAVNAVSARTKLPAKTIAIAAGIILAVIVVVFLFTKHNPSQPDFKKMIPQNIYEYTINGDTYTSKLKSVDVLRSDVENDMYVADAVLLLDDKQFSRNVTVSLSAKKYDNGGWMVESCNISDYETLEWKEPSRDGFANQCLDASFYDTIKQTESSQTEQNAWAYTFDVSKSMSLLDISGQATVELYLHEHTDTLPVNYRVASRLQNAGISQNWKIDGTWKTTEFTDYDEVSLTFNVNSDAIEWNGVAAYTNINGEMDSYSDKGSFSIPEVDLDHIEDIELNNSFWIGYPYFNLKISPDSMSMSEGATPPSSKHYVEMKK